MPNAKKYSEMSRVNPGPVCLVGAGPGGLSLITPAALKAIASADVIYYDRLIGSDIIAFLPKTAELIDVGKNPDGTSVPQSEINKMIGDSAMAGKRVVRLKGGDPFVFGRGGEEMEYLRNLGIHVTFVPGITSGIAVPESVGIPVTHRGISRSVTLVTGHEGSIDKTDWSWYAKCPGTLVIYMGSSKISEIATALCINGMSPETKTAVIEHGFSPACNVHCQRLEELAAGIHTFDHPAIIVIGEVAGLYRIQESS